MGNELEDLAAELYILEKAAQRKKKIEEELEEELKKERKKPDIKIPEGDFFKTINEIKSNSNLECNSINKNTEILTNNQFIIQSEILDKELRIIEEKIKKSKPKWILDDFTPFLYNDVDKVFKTKSMFVKITDGDIAKSLLKIGDRLQGEKNLVFKIIWKYDVRFMQINRELDQKKIFDLIRAYIFYSNTKYNRKKLKFTRDCFSLAVLKAYGLIIGLPIIGVILLVIIIICI